MALRRLALASLAVVAASLVVVAPVDAKDGVKATLTTSIPLDAQPRTQLNVAWRLFSLDESGQRVPFGANGVFVRLRSAVGAAAAESFAPIGAYSTGEYEATVVVPEGGIGDVEIGLMGWRSDATGTRRADANFPITNDPLPEAERNASPESNERVAGDQSEPVAGDSRSGSTAWILSGVGATLAVLAVLALAVQLSRKRKRAATAADRGEPAGEFAERAV